ncbi:MAG: DHA2 family efflux MFS transporter permease subunit [Alphaproteobacteria bacterium]|nr:DHA2 family efflux MFS transporter permease subunit [Alphaproteobacteria bacterium]
MSGTVLPLTSRRTRLTALIVACALLMQNLDSTVVATALPTMAKAFGAEPVRMNVAMTSYLLSLAVFIPASGWMADRYGARTVFRAAIAVFTVGSILCGRAESLPFLVGARVLQGMGGAMMVPVGRLVLLRSAPKSELVAAMAWLTMPAMLGPVLGPPVGGFIVTYFSWRWLFDINVPIGMIGILLVTLFVEDVREPGPGKLDFRGLVLSGVGLATLLFGLETTGRGVVSPALSEGMIGAGLLAWMLYGLHARRHPRPLLDFSLIREPTFAVSVIAGSFFRVGVGALPFLLPMLFQLGFGASAARSGAITFASAAGALVMKPVAQRALRRLGFRATLIWNAVLCTAMLALCAAFRPDWPSAAIYLVLLVSGFFRSLQFTAYSTLAYAEISRAKMSAATSLFSTAQYLCQIMGIAAGAAALEASMWLHGHTGPALGDFSFAFLSVALVTLIAAPLSASMPRTAGDEIAGRAPSQG